MNEASQARRETQAVRAVASALVPKNRLNDRDVAEAHEHLILRIGTIQILLDDQIAELSASCSRAKALPLILLTDFCWQVLRALGGKKGDDSNWIEAALPQDHQASDADIGDSFYARQIEIVQDGKWVFELHTALRHPGSSFTDYVWLLREPVPQQHCDRLLRAARGIRALLLTVHARMYAV